MNFMQKKWFIALISAKILYLLSIYIFFKEEK